MIWALYTGLKIGCFILGIYMPISLFRGLAKRLPK